MTVVEVFCTENCRKCDEIKDFFKSNEIIFTDIYVGKDITVEKFLEISGRLEVPVIFIDGKQFNGVKIKDIKKELKI